MPFTFAHPSVLLPLLKNQRLSCTALVIGSMAPDFEYFLRLRLKGVYGHTWWGMLYFDVPVTILLALCFHLVVKKQLFANLPDYLRSRWMIYAEGDWLAYFKRSWFQVMLAAAFGALTHILWDAFTHNNTFIVRSIPLLRTQVSLYFEEYPLYHLLQHASSVIGLFFVVRYIMKMPAVSTETPAKLVSRGFWPAVGVLCVAIAGTVLYRMSLNELVKIGHVIVIGLGGLMYALIIVSAFYLWKFRRPGKDGL